MTNENFYLYIGAGVAVLVCCVCLFCMLRYYGKNKSLATNPKVVALKMKNDKQKEKMEIEITKAQNQGLEMGSQDLISDRSNTSSQILKMKEQDIKDKMQENMVELFFPKERDPEAGGEAKRKIL